MKPLTDAFTWADTVKSPSVAHGVDLSSHPPVSTRYIEEDPAPAQRRSDGAPHLGISSAPSGSSDNDGDAAGRRVSRPLPERPAAGESRSSAHRAFDPRTLPRRPGLGRIVATVLSLLVVVGAWAGGGYFVWKTELVRPALVRRLPPMPVSDMNLSPVHAANAAMNVAANAVVPASDGSVESRAIPVVETAGSGRAERMPVPAQEQFSARPASPGFSPEQPARVRSGDRNDLPAFRTPAPAAAVEPPARDAAGAFPDTIGSAEPGPAHAGAGPRSEPGAGIVIRKRIRADHVAVSLERAYDALLAGDDEAAAEAYRAVLGHEPGNRDARFGLAAVAVRAGRWNEAAGHYTRILASHPADTVARAALIAIHEEDPARGESRLKALLRSEPEGAHLHFDLGNLYAAQSRWPEAQQSYFNAYRFDRGNADYAYNLAVSLDHLSQPASALGLYREAVDLSRTRHASFEAAAVQQRIGDLESLAGASSTPSRATGEAAVAAPVR